jgi:hypothetical protein
VAKDKATASFEREKRQASQSEHLANVKSLIDLQPTDDPFPTVNRLVNRFGSDEEKAKAAELAKKYKEAKEKRTNIADIFAEARDFGLSVNERLNPYSQRGPKEDKAAATQLNVKNHFLKTQ